MTTIEELGRRAKQASRLMNRMGTTQKNQILALAAQALVDEQEEILKANGYKGGKREEYAGADGGPSGFV